MTAALVVVLAVAWLASWTVVVYIHALERGRREGYARALEDRAGLLELAANLASRYAVSVDEAQKLILAGLTPSSRPKTGGSNPTRAEGSGS